MGTKFYQHQYNRKKKKTNLFGVFWLTRELFSKLFQKPILRICSFSQFVANFGEIDRVICFSALHIDRLTARNLVKNPFLSSVDPKTDMYTKIQLRFLYYHWTYLLYLYYYGILCKKLVNTKTLIQMVVNVRDHWPLSITLNLGKVLQY